MGGRWGGGGGKLGNQKALKKGSGDHKNLITAQFHGYCCFFNAQIFKNAFFAHMHTHTYTHTHTCTHTHIHTHTHTHTHTAESDHSDGYSPESPRLCYGCKKPIEDKYRLCVSPDLDWHTSCLVCAECNMNMDENWTCFLKEGRTYCKKDYVR